jgi:hypothetical protein
VTAHLKVAILDDYQNVALEMADWTPVAERADIGWQGSTSCS